MKTLSRNILISIIIIFSVSGLSNAQYLSETNLQNRTGFFADTTKKKIKLTYKSPLAAGSLSFFLPGLSMGQLYNEDYLSFGIHLGASAGILLFAIIAKQQNLYELSTMNIGGGPGKPGKREWIFALCILSYLGNWLWSTVDAIHYATMNNREIQRQRKTGYNNIRLMLAPGIGRNNKPNFNISVCF